jgi:hypothetical protein
MKKRLTASEEFEIMKLVLDKFLWLGFVIMGFGMYIMIADTGDSIAKGLSVMLSGAVVLVLFLILIVKEYEIIR